MKHIVSFSTGLSSALTVERVLKERENVSIVFMDTKIEDEDNYRFMSDCQKRWGVDIIILSEGRDPYKVFSDQNLIPNNRIAPCTHRLKIEVFKKYLASVEKPATIHIGYDYTEMHRIETTKRNYEEMGFSVDFPLLWKPYEFRPYSQVVREDWGIEPPRMYGMGYTHANCGGRCVKQGQGDWLRTLQNFPERYAEAEQWEIEMRQLSEKHGNFAILKSQTKEGTVPLTLTELRERYQNNMPASLFDLDKVSACVVCGVGA